MWLDSGVGELYHISLFYFCLVEGEALILYILIWRWYFWVCRNVRWRKHYHDSYHEQEWCRLDYLLVPMSDICSCKVSTNIIWWNSYSGSCSIICIWHVGWIVNLQPFRCPFFFVGDNDNIFLYTCTCFTTASEGPSTAPTLTCSTTWWPRQLRVRGTPIGLHSEFRYY